MNRTTVVKAETTQERLKRFHVKHITNPLEIDKIQLEFNYQPPSGIKPRYLPNPEYHDFSRNLKTVQQLFHTESY